MQRMTWGTGKDHGTAMPQTAPSGAVEIGEDEKTTAALAAKEFLRRNLGGGPFFPQQQMIKGYQNYQKQPTFTCNRWRGFEILFSIISIKCRSRLCEAELWHMFGRFLPFWILLEKRLTVGATFKINTCQFCNLSRAIFKSLLLKFVVLISEPVHTCTCRYDFIETLNCNSCCCFPECKIAALPLEIEAIRCDPIVRGRGNSCRHCAVACSGVGNTWEHQKSSMKRHGR